MNEMKKEEAKRKGEKRRGHDRARDSRMTIDESASELLTHNPQYVTLRRFPA